MAAEHHEAVGAAAEGAAHAAEAGGHPPELPNIIYILHGLYPDNAFVQFLYDWNYQIYALICVCAIAFLFRMAGRGASIVPNRIQAFAEILIESLLGAVTGILGEKEGRRYFPFLGSLFIFILVMNWSGLVPLMRAPTSSIKVTAALAICVFLFCQYNALVRLGPKKYLHHLMGEPADPVTWLLVPLFLPLHLMEELIKPLSLACRLYGNILGEDILLGVGLTLGILLMGALWSGTFFGIPFHLPFIFLSMLLGTIQALVFTLLATVYISSTLPHEEHHEEHSAV